MSKTFNEISREIQSGRIDPVYAAIGNETWGKNKFLKLLKETVVEESMADFNFDSLNASDTKGVVAADKAGMLPMMSDRRLVIVDDCDSWKTADHQAILKYLDNLNDKAVLVLVFKSADKRKKLFQSKKLRKLEFNRPKPWELEKYIAELARDMKLQLVGEALSLVAEMAGDDLEKVHRELDKLTLYKLGENRITAEDVAALMGRTRQVTRWELNEYVGNRDLAGALMKLHDIIASGEEPIGLLSTINSHMKQLFTAKALMIKGVRDKNQVGSFLRVPPRIADSLMQQQRNYSDYELRRAFDLMRAADFRLKSVAMDKNLILDHLVCEILTRTEYSPPGAKGRR